MVLVGDKDVPKSKFGLSSLKQLHPGISPYLWAGKPYIKNTVIVSNLFNHTPTPIEDGWSVLKTQMQDFRGRQLTYDSHNATDFAIPIGSTVVASAPGEVVAIVSEFNRGGLKIFIDHGQNLMTSYVHLARALVKVGDVVGRGQTIALSGYSGLDGFSTLPFGIPHVHFNTWLNGVPVDPFPYDGNPSLWLGGDLPAPPQETGDTDFTPSVYNEEQVNEAIAQCKTPETRTQLQAMDTLKYRAAHTIIEMNYYPTRFNKRVNVYETNYPRTARLDLPFPASDFNRVVFLDDL